MNYTNQEMNDLNNLTMIIYKIINLVNKKVYIGQTVNTFNRRYGGKGVGAERITECYTNNWHLLRAINKHGANNFKVEIIEKCETMEELNKKESFYIDEYNSEDDEHGYNKKSGGENNYWHWDKVLRTYVINESKFKYEVKKIKQISKKINTDYKKVTREMYKNPVLKISKKTGKITVYDGILHCCFRDEDGKPNKNSMSDSKTIYSLTDILITCKQFQGDPSYLPLKHKQNKCNDFYFCKDVPHLMKQYCEQVNDLSCKTKKEKK